MFCFISCRTFIIKWLIRVEHSCLPTEEAVHSMCKAVEPFYLDTSEAFGTQEALALCSNVSPAPLKQVDDGCPPIPGVGVVLGEAEPEQSDQNEKLHVSRCWVRKTTGSVLLHLCFYSTLCLSGTNGKEPPGLILKLSRCLFPTFSKTGSHGLHSNSIHARANKPHEALRGKCGCQHHRLFKNVIRSDAPKVFSHENM